MPVVDSFPTRLREELESAYDDDIDEVFDVTAVRNALESRLKALESELHQVSLTNFELGPTNLNNRDAVTSQVTGFISLQLPGLELEKHFLCCTAMSS